MERLVQGYKSSLRCLLLKRKRSDITVNGGSELLALYGGYFSRALIEIFPEHPWNLTEFTRDGNILIVNHKLELFGFWEKPENIRSAFFFVEKALNIQTPEEWLNVSGNQFRNYGCYRLVERFGGVKELLEHIYPGRQLLVVEKV